MSTLRVDNIKSRTGSIVTVPETNTLAVTGIVSVTSTGSITNAGNLTNSGTLTNSGNVNITGGITTVGGAATISGNVFISGITTISGNLVNTGTFTQSGTFSPTNINTSGSATVGSLTVTNDATVGGALTVTGNFTVNGTTTTIDTVNLVVEDKNIGIGTTTSASNTTADGGGITIFGGAGGDKTLTWNNATPAYWALGGGYLQVPGVDFSSLLREGANITAGKLSDNTNINLENGMVHLFTTTETTTSTPNIRYNSSTSLNTVMNTGEAISVTLITTAAAAAYSAQLTIDGSNVTEYWIGGIAPSAGGSSGYDLHIYTIIKTASASFTVIANRLKTSA